jgi:hypothetical protein
VGRRQLRGRSGRRARRRDVPGQAARCPSVHGEHPVRQRRRADGVRLLGGPLPGPARPLPDRAHAGSGRGPRVGIGGRHRAGRRAVPVLRPLRSAAIARGLRAQRGPGVDRRRPRPRLRGDAVAARRVASRGGGGPPGRGGAPRAGREGGARGPPGAHQSALLLQHAQHDLRAPLRGPGKGRRGRPDPRRALPLHVQGGARRRRAAPRGAGVRGGVSRRREGPLRGATPGDLGDRSARPRRAGSGADPAAARRECRRARRGPDARRGDGADRGVARGGTPGRRGGGRRAGPAPGTCLADPGRPRPRERPAAQRGVLELLPAPKGRGTLARIVLPAGESAEAADAAAPAGAVERRA